MDLADLARAFLADHHGNVEYFDHRDYLDQRMGQAFFNSLPPSYAETIRGKGGVDPFYQDELIPQAIGYLLHMETVWKEAAARKAANSND